MIIHSLNLNEGGGIIPQNDVSNPEPVSSVIIGIGGTGVDTIKKIKRSIYTQLNPSNPGEAVPSYDMIRLLAIDTDDTNIGDSTRNTFELDRDSEFVSLKHPALSAALDPHSPNGRAKLRNQMEYNTWMSIDTVEAALGEAGAGTVRQMGRFMLMNKASDVYLKIQNSIHQSMIGNKVNGQVNIHIIAGISGGTGSGCFLDVCYLVRNILENNGLTGKIFGYFYLPDVVISKPAVKGDPLKVTLNRCNGYAAFRELDYLMNLEQQHEWFDVSYPGNLPKTHTQKPPVDLCHLVSATDASGNIPEEAYNYSLSVVTDYIMAYLSHVELNSGVTFADNGGLTMEGHLSNIKAGVQAIVRDTGASLNYTILGASNAEVPFSQIATYLAQGYYEKFASIYDNTPGQASLDEFVHKVGLEYGPIEKSLMKGVSGCGGLRSTLEDTDYKDAHDAHISAESMHPAALLRPTVAWFNHSRGVIEANLRGLSDELESFGPVSLGTNSSYIARIHAELLQLCANADELAGAGFAARLLSNNGKDLVDVIDGLILQNSKNLAHEQGQSHLADLLEQARDAFMQAPEKGFLGIPNGALKGLWKDYVSAMVQYYDNQLRVYKLQELDLFLHTLKKQCQELYTEYYQKLDKLCRNLRETFAQNAVYLNNPDEVRKTNAYTWRIIELSDVKEKLDETIRQIEPVKATADLMNYLQQPKVMEAWLSEADYRIGRVINSFMLEEFHELLSKTLEDIIKELPQYRGMKEAAVIQAIKNSVLTKADINAEPMFWLSQGYRLDSGNAFACSTMTIPAASTTITSAAESFKMHNPHNYAIRETGIGDRIFALRFYSGLPLYAYQGVSLMYHDYTTALKNGKAGMHLFEHNIALERKENKTAEDYEVIRKSAWGTYLPYPTPFSIMHINGTPLTEEEEAASNAFERALEVGIIHQNANNSWCIYENRTDVAPLCGNTRNSFINGGVFSHQAANMKLSELERMKDSWTSLTTCKEYELLGSIFIKEGSVKTVLKDIYMRSPKMVDKVKKCVADYEALCSEMDSISEIVGEESKGNQDLQQFANALETGLLIQKIGKIVYMSNRFALPTEEVLSADTENLGAPFLLYRAYNGYKALTDAEKAAMAAVANSKLNDLQEGDDAAAQKYLQHIQGNLPMIQAALVGKPDEWIAEILKFYGDVRNALSAFVQQFQF